MLPKQLEEIKEKLLKYEGINVLVNENGGRSKDRTVKGIMCNCYASVFVIEDSQLKYCYSYGDVLTKKVEVLVEGQKIG